MKPRILSIGLLAALAAGAPAAADDADQITNQPAASLLLPYFEVALPKKPGGKPAGVTTVFSITNTASAAALARVTVWSDLAVPVTAFDVYLTGYDVETIDMADVVAGRLPITASNAQDPTDEISPKGAVSSDFTFASCSGLFPYPEEIGEAFADHMRAALTGEPSPYLGDRCAGRKYDEKRPVARGYVTVDTVNACSLLFPDNPGYFVSGGAGFATNQNILVGDYYYVDRGRAHGDALVSVRADALDPETSVAGEYSFYTRFNPTPADNRQPLATQFAGRFVNDPRDRLFPGGTDVIAWRDPKQAPATPFNCAAQPSWFPLFHEQIVVFDEEENPQVPEQPPVPPIPPDTFVPFPAATQRVEVGSADFPVDFARGWIFMNLSTTLPVVVPAEDPAAAQAFVTMVFRGKTARTAVRATQLDGASNAAHTVIPIF